MRVKLVIVLILIKFSALGQWNAFNLGISKGIDKINCYSFNETYLFCQNEVLKSTDSCKTWSSILSNPSRYFYYMYKYNDDSAMFLCIVGRDNQNLYRHYSNGVNKLIRDYTYNVIENNIWQFDKDTFLNIFNDIGGGYLGVLINQYAYNADVLPYKQTYVYALYYISFADLMGYQLVDDTLITVSNRLDYYRTSLYPIISRNNIRHWSIDTINQEEMKNLAPSRGVWAYNADDMFLLGHNYIARLNPFPKIQSLYYYPDFSFKKVLFTTHDTGFVIGRNKITDRGVILRTTDAGVTWKQQQMVSCPPINDIVALNKKTLIAVCNEGVLLRTDNGGSNPVGIEAPQPLYASVFPNPAQSHGFTLQVPNHSFTYSIYDATGNEVLHGEAAGHIQLDSRGMLPGIYMVVIRAEGQTTSNKLVIYR